MTINSRQGQPAVITVHWSDSGVDADVTNLTIRIVNSLAEVILAPTAVGVEHISTGLYLYTWTINPALPAGTYTVVWSADAFVDPGSQTQTDSVVVAAVYGAAYVTVDQVKDSMQIKNSRQDNQIALNVVAASRAIDRRCGQSFFRDAAATTREVDGFGRVVARSGGAILLTPPIATASGLLVSGVTTVEYGPSACLEQGMPITELRGTSWNRYLRYLVTAVWGWPSVPPEIESAALLQATRLTRRPASPEGVAGSAEWGLVRIPNLDPDVRALCEPYRLPGIA